MVFMPGYVSHVELIWDAAGIAAFLRGIAEQARVLVFDKRGTGLSDRVAGAPTLEERSDDIRAVMDAAGSQRAALFGLSEGVPMGVVFAASHPERVSALVLYGGMARTLWAPDYLFGETERESRKGLEEELEEFVTVATWQDGAPESVALTYQQIACDPWVWWRWLIPVLDTLTRPFAPRTSPAPPRSSSG